MNAYSDLVDRYLAVWNETDADAHAAAVGALFTPDATYVAPLADVRGHEQIAAASRRPPRHGPVRLGAGPRHGLTTTPTGRSPTQTPRPR